MGCGLGMCVGGWKINKKCGKTKKTESVLRLASSWVDGDVFCLGFLCCLWWACSFGCLCPPCPPFFRLPCPLPFLPEAEPVWASLFLAPRTFRISTSRSSSCQISPTVAAAAGADDFRSVDGAPPSTWEGSIDMEAAASRHITMRFI